MTLLVLLSIYLASIVISGTFWALSNDPDPLSRVDICSIFLPGLNTLTSIALLLITFLALVDQVLYTLLE